VHQVIYLLIRIITVKYIQHVQRFRMSSVNIALEQILTLQILIDFLVDNIAC